MSVGVHNNRIYLFGGQEDDNRKLNDMWVLSFENADKK